MPRFTNQAQNFRDSRYLIHVYATVISKINFVSKLKDKIGLKNGRNVHM